MKCNYICNFEDRLIFKMKKGKEGGSQAMRGLGEVGNRRKVFPDFFTLSKRKNLLNLYKDRILISGIVNGLFSCSNIVFRT